MRKVFFLLSVFLFPGFAQPVLVYEPPSVSKFEVYFLAGRSERGKYHLAGGFDWRVGYPFLAGIFYGKEKGLDGIGARAKVRLALFGKLKNDLSLGAVFERGSGKRVSFLVQMEQLLFVKRSFSFRLLEGYVFGNEEVRRWVIAAGFGF